MSNQGHTCDILVILQVRPIRNIAVGHRSDVQKCYNSGSHMGRSDVVATFRAILHLDSTGDRSDVVVTSPVQH